jgi:hypothetical protein
VKKSSGYVRVLVDVETERKGEEDGEHAGRALNRLAHVGAS